MNSNIELTLNKDKYLLYTVNGSSMLPLLKENETVVRIEKASIYSINDVVLYKKDNNYVLHRIKDISKDIYYIVGDNSIQIDEVDSNHILGKLVGFYVNDKYIDISNKEYLEYISNYVIKNNTFVRKYIIDKSIFKINEAYHEIIRYSLSLSYNKDMILSLNEIELNKLVKICCESKAGHILYLIYDELKLNLSSLSINELAKKYNLVKMRYMLFKHAQTEISNLLKDYKIKHLYLKWGEVIDKYRNPILRSMNDIDIYVDDINKSIDALKNKYKIEITSKDKSIHYSITIKDLNVHVELHHKFIDGNSNVNNLLIDAFNGISDVDENNAYLYHLKKEYYYIYNLAHIRKHISYLELYLPNIMDLYLLKNMDYDFNLLTKLLEKSNLTTFNKRIEELLALYISSRLSSLEVYILEQYINEHIDPSYIGNSKASYSKFIYLYRKIFLPYETLCVYSPRVKKHKILVPIYQIKRWISRIFSKRIFNIKKELSAYNRIDKNILKKVYNYFDI